jgi:putative SOS response-associated peptidase YedK
MCGRYTLHTSPEVIAELFDLPAAPALADRYNIAPTQPVAIVRESKSDAAREWALVLWGLIPSWSKDPSMGARMINARAETVEEKPAFRAAFKRRRCLLPADGFYEWQSRGKAKQPYYITMRDGSPFAFAGLWESWTGPDGSTLESTTILTTEPNELMATLHNRMPVIIDPQDYGLWLGSAEDVPREPVDVLRHLLRPYPTEAMDAYPVSKYVNSPANEGAECIAPLGERQ